MKIIFFLVFGFLGILNSAFGQETVNNVRVVGTIKGAGDSKLFIGRIGEYFMNAQIVDSFACKNDSFNYQANFEKSDDLFCIKDSNGQFLYFLPDNDKVIINGNSDNLIFSSIDGSENNILLTDYWKSFSSILNQRLSLFPVLKKAQEQHNTITIRNVTQQLDSLYSIIQYQREKFIAINYTNNAAAVILYLNLSEFRSDKLKLKTLYAKLDKKVQDSPVGRRVSAFITSLDACGVGDRFTDFELADQADRSIAISSLKGKYFLIEFWTTWCGPCRGELPTLSKAYEKYKTKGFEILSISLDNSRQQWIKALEKQKTPWLQTIIKNSERFKDNLAPFESDVAKAYSILYVPANYLVNTEGLIIATDLRGQALIDKLSEIYKD